MSIILDILFPKKCVGCKKQREYFCKNCISNILQTNLVCPKCEDLAVGGQTHPLCQIVFGLDGLWSLGIYKRSFPSPFGEQRNPLREGIKQLKYGRVKGLAESLVDIMVEYWAKYQPFILDQIKRNQGKGCCIIPVPLHWWRENERGFNQSSLLGQLLSKKIGLAYCDGLKRVHYTKPQVKLKDWQRHQNIRGAFEVAKPYTLDPIFYLLMMFGQQEQL